MPEMFILSNGEEIIPHSQRGKDTASLIRKVKEIIQEKGNETTTYTYERLKSGNLPLGEHQITIRWSDE